MTTITTVLAVLGISVWCAVLLHMVIFARLKAKNVYWKKR